MANWISRFIHFNGSELEHTSAANESNAIHTHANHVCTEHSMLDSCLYRRLQQSRFPQSKNTAHRNRCQTDKKHHSRTKSGGDFKMGQSNQHHLLSRPDIAQHQFDEHSIITFSSPQAHGSHCPPSHSSSAPSSSPPRHCALETPPHTLSWTHSSHFHCHSQTSSPLASLASGSDSYSSSSFLARTQGRPTPEWGSLTSNHNPHRFLVYCQHQKNSSWSSLWSYRRQISPYPCSAEID